MDVTEPFFHLSLIERVPPCAVSLGQNQALEERSVIEVTTELMLSANVKMELGLQNAPLHAEVLGDGSVTGSGWLHCVCPQNVLAVLQFGNTYRGGKLFLHHLKSGRK